MHKVLLYLTFISGHRSFGFGKKLLAKTNNESLLLDTSYDQNFEEKGEDYMELEVSGGSCSKKGEVKQLDALGCGGRVELKCDGGCIEIQKVRYSCQEIDRSIDDQFEKVKRRCENKESCTVSANRRTFGNSECRGKPDNDMLLWLGYRCNGDTKDDRSRVTGRKRCPRTTTKKAATTTTFGLSIVVSTRATTKKPVVILPPPPPVIITPPPKVCPNKRGRMRSYDIPLRGGWINIQCGKPSHYNQLSCIFIHKVMAGCQPGNAIPNQMSLVKARCEGKPSCKLSPGNLPFNPRIRCNGWPRMWITYSCDGTSIDNTKVYIPPRPTTRRPWRPPPRRPPPRPGVGVVACFSENSIVETESGKKSMSSLVLGDLIATFKPGKGKVFTKFLGWLDRGPQVINFLKITTKLGHEIELTKTHLIFVLDNGKQMIKFARDVTLQNKVLVWNGKKIEQEEIGSIQEVFQKGYRNPLTEEGTLLVDNILVSCYASYDHFWSEIAFAPVKAFPYLLEDKSSQHLNGVRQVVKLIKFLGRLIGVRVKEKIEDTSSWSLSKMFHATIDSFEMKIEL